ncbi:propanediol utilization protein PduU [Enterococcus termitis]|nr:propanediol utilization protein PduU [Enterococcus termitis]
MLVNKEIEVKILSEKQRMIQEYVPGKQITLAHIIANPNPEIYEKLGLVDVQTNAIGILTITPSEAAIIAVDIATKAGDITIGFIDRFSGSVVITGDIASVESALGEVLTGLGNILGFNETHITKT